MRNEDGFTLIELLIVTAMIGILASLAIPNYFQFKKNALNAGAKSDVRNIATAAELVSTETSPPGTFVLSGTPGDIAELPGARLTEDTYGVVTVEANHYAIEAYNLHGTLCYRLDSTTGWETLDRADCGV